MMDGISIATGKPSPTAAGPAVPNQEPKSEFGKPSPSAAGPIQEPKSEFGKPSPSAAGHAVSELNDDDICSPPPPAGPPPPTATATATATATGSGLASVDELSLARDFLVEHRFSKALPSFDASLEALLQRKAALLVGKAVCLEMKGESKLAHGCFLEAIRLQPKRGLVLVLSCGLQFDENMLELASEVYEKSLTSDPSFHVAAKTLSLVALGQSKLSRKAYDPSEYDSFLYPRRIMKSAMFHRLLGDEEGESSVLDTGLEFCKYYDKLWLMKGQLEERLLDMVSAISTYSKGVNHCPLSLPLWFSVMRVKMSIDDNPAGIGRAVLMQARQALAGEEAPPVLFEDWWVKNLEFSAEFEDVKCFEKQMSLALSAFPRSGLIRSATIRLAKTKPQRNSYADKALAKLGAYNPYIVAAIGDLKFDEADVESARVLFNLAVALDPQNGDFWARLYNLESGTYCSLGVVERCIISQPKNGFHWNQISKKVENWYDPTELLLKKSAKALEASRTVHISE